MPLVEVVTQPQSSDAAITRAVNFVKAIGKTPVVVKDGPGFLVNRLLLPQFAEAGYLLEEGHRITNVDRAMKKFGMPMGTFELLDEIGLDVGLKVSHILHASLGEHYRPADAISNLVERSKKDSQPRFGRKTGLGFYVWDSPGGKRLQPDQEKIDALVFQNGSRKSPPEFTDEAIVRRLVFPMINEAARILAEKLVDEPAQIDLAMIFGTGFPPFRGGLLKYADSVGLENIVAELDRLAKAHGSRLAASEALKALAKGPGKFYALVKDVHRDAAKSKNARPEQLY